jgi:hypothetical protein
MFYRGYEKMNTRISVLQYLCYLGAGLAAIALFNGTGDAGDSITHYLYARHAPQHPMAFFNHWAKPLFLLLAAPWAQFGFVGIKLFNLVVSILAALLTHLAARRIGLANNWIVPVVYLLTPLQFVLTFSGLTEPLFALLLAAGLLLFVSNRVLVAAMVVSFLPFVRSAAMCSQVDDKLLEGEERLTLLGAFSSSSKEKAYSIKVFGYE